MSATRHQLTIDQELLSDGYFPCKNQSSNAVGMCKIAVNKYSKIEIIIPSPLLLLKKHQQQCWREPCVENVHLY